MYTFKYQVKLSVENRNIEHVYLHMLRRSDICWQVVTRDPCGDAFQCELTYLDLWSDHLGADNAGQKQDQDQDVLG